MKFTPEYLREAGYVEMGKGNWFRADRSKPPLDRAASEPKPDNGKFVIKHQPVPAPRMTRRDKWLNPRRPCVQRYFDYRDVVQKAVGDLPTVPHTMKFIFYFPVPDSWSKKKQAEMIGQKHRQRPDSDNCIKAVMDALFIHDGGVSDIVSSKRWCERGGERIELIIET